METEATRFLTRLIYLDFVGSLITTFPIWFHHSLLFRLKALGLLYLMRIYDKKRMFYTIALEDGGEKKKNHRNSRSCEPVNFLKEKFCFFWRKHETTWA